MPRQMPESQGRLADGPETAEERFNRCFEAHYGDILSYAVRRTGQRSSAEEVAAETFAVAWRKRDAIPGDPLPWLYAVARRVFANYRRSGRRRAALHEKLAALPSSVGADPADVISSRQTIQAALTALTEGEREVLFLVALEGLETKQAAEALGCSATAFRVRLHRARRRLEKQLRSLGHVTGKRGKSSTHGRASGEVR